MERFLDMFVAFRIKPDLASSTKEGVIEELIDILFDACIIDIEKRKAILEAVLEREMIVSTGIGNGLAIPHCHYENIEGPIGSFGRIKEGVEFDSLDGEPAYLFFLVVTPKKDSEAHIKILSSISEALGSGDFYQKLLEAETEEKIKGVLNSIPIVTKVER